MEFSVNDLDLYVEFDPLELWAEELPDAEAPGCCWGCGGSFSSAGTFGGTLSTGLCVGSGSCAC
jgi:hypothetical protein